MPQSTSTEFLESLERRRRDLGMTWDALAARSGVSRATLCRLLQGHVTTASFHAVVAVAEALGYSMRFDGDVMRAEPFDLDDVLKQQAEHQARKLVGMVQGTMALEAQALSKRELDRLIKRTSRQLLAGSKARLWYD